MFLSLALIFILGLLGGYLFEKIKIPKIVFYIFLGILLGPSLFNIISPSLLNISTYLRQIALVIILTRSGLSLDIKKLKEIGRSAILMCFLPATFEIIGVCIFAPMILNISILESLLLGSVLAAVSPAIVVPRMIKLQNEGYGNKNHVSELIMAGASCDDIYVIVLFYSFKSLVSSSTISFSSFLQIPISIIMGIICGIVFAILLILIFKKFSISTPVKVGLLLGVSFLLLEIETLLKQYISISALLAIIVIGIIILKFLPNQAKEIQSSYNSLWNIFELLLFSLVGMAIDAKYAFSKEGLLILLLIIIALLFRSLGVICCLIATKFTFKEKLFIIFSYLPKATVQASIGAIALNEGLECGLIILVAAVIAILFTAPLGAILMDNTYKKLLIKE